MDYRNMVKRKILELAGSVANVVQLGGEEYQRRLLQNGIYYENPQVIESTEAGWGACHNNSIYKWLENQKNLRICSGYARDGDVWYRHTWCVDKDGVIYECTAGKREHYYGLSLNEEETRAFIEAMLPPNEVENALSKIDDSYER